MSQPKQEVVMALYPSSKGLGYCIFKGPKSLVDWGYCDFRINKTKRTLKKISVLIDLYIPDIAILEDTQAVDSRRQKRIIELTKTITEFLIKKGIPVQHYSMQEVELALQTTNKDERAKQIAESIPELKDYLPPRRKPWKSVHQRMQIFDAVSLALTYFYMNHY